MGMPATSDHYWLPADLEQFPEGDGCKYECIDGMLLVTPAPRMGPAVALGRLERILDRAGAKPRVIISTADVRVEPDAVVQPDLFVLREPGTGRTPLHAPPFPLLS